MILLLLNACVRAVAYHRLGIFSTNLEMAIITTIRLETLLDGRQPAVATTTAVVLVGVFAL